MLFSFRPFVQHTIVRSTLCLNAHPKHNEHLSLHIEKLCLTESREQNKTQHRGERQQLTTMKCSCQNEVMKGEKEVITHH